MIAAMFTVTTGYVWIGSTVMRVNVTPDGKETTVIKVSWIYIRAKMMMITVVAAAAVAAVAVAVAMIMLYPFC